MTDTNEPETVRLSPEQWEAIRWLFEEPEPEAPNHPSAEGGP